MSRYEVVIDLNGGDKLLIKSVLIERYSNNHETNLMYMYCKEGSLQCEPDYFSPEAGVAYMKTNHFEHPRVRALILNWIDEERSLFTVTGHDEEAVQICVNDFMPFCTEAGGKARKTMMQLINSYMTGFRVEALAKSMGLFNKEGD